MPVARTPSGALTTGIESRQAAGHEHRPTANYQPGGSQHAAA